ncbi:signal transduction histidine kinase [Solimonas aquatica]|uniref:histidine kinase n=1 Tax=Solimonas aquatica TaxID=489703 RepID=A0A1H9AG22_9GAMM|nr:HAMP domain-containing sensor histidine kinase [Solimonas aquatica]SEP75461.1 signal transduction histidine kinase [Solimonas aquatica]
MGLALSAKTNAQHRAQSAKGWRARGAALLPKTMAGLISASCLLAALPLLIALLLSALSLERITRRTEALIDEGVAVAQLSSQLEADLGHLERSLRQYEVLSDASLQALAQKRWNTALRTTQLLAAQPLDATLASRATALRQSLGEAQEAWQQAPQDAGALALRLRAMAQQVDAVILAARQRTQLRMDELRGATLSARRDMLICALTLIPLAAALALACSLTVTRPLRRLYRSIAALGHGRNVPEPRIGYPREMHRLAQQLGWLQRRLADLEEDKERFLRQVSHELKTPLASLSEGSALLGDGTLGRLNAKQQEVTTILREASGELEALIHNLLAYAQWRQNRRRAEHEWFAAKDLLDEVLSKHSLSLSRRGLRVLLQLHCERLYGQRAQLRVVLDNLLTNAIKHAPADSDIEIGGGGQSQRCELSVRDRGRGIAPQERERIFEPFVRGSDADEQRVRGTGIGLSIVKEVITAHDGIITVEDAQPGARFRLVWPHPRV